MQTDVLLATNITLYYCQLIFVAALLNFIGTLPAELFFRLLNFGEFKKDSPWIE